MAVHSQQILSEVPADAVQLHDYPAQMLGEVDGLPLQLGAAGGFSPQEETVALPVLDQPLQVEAEGPEDFLHELADYSSGGLLLDGERGLARVG